LVGGRELGRTEDVARGGAGPGSVQAALVEGAPDGVRRAEQGGRRDRPLFRASGPCGIAHVHGNGVDHGGKRGAFHPAGRGSQRGGKPLPAAGFVSVREGDQGQPGVQVTAHPVPPRRLLLVQPGQDLRAAAGRRGHVSFAPVQFRSYQGQPGPCVAEARTALGLDALGLLQVRPGAFQVALPEPDRGEQPVDVGKVSPGSELLAERPCFFQGRDRRREVSAELGEFGQLDQHGGGPPRLSQRAEPFQGPPAVGLGPVETAEHASEGAAQQRHGRPQPRVR
jgi:hypothetical protein